MAIRVAVLVKFVATIRSLSVKAKSVAATWVALKASAVTTFAAPLIIRVSKVVAPPLAFEAVTFVSALSNVTRAGEIETRASRAIIHAVAPRLPDPASAQTSSAPAPTAEATLPFSSMTTAAGVPPAPNTSPAPK